MMPEPEIEDFAKLVVRLIRDAAIRGCDLNTRPGVSHVVAARWRASGSDLASIADSLIPDVVDETIFQLLHSIDQGLLPLAYIEPGGRVVDLAAEGRGELAGWYMGSKGWRSLYSDQRFVDDFSELR